MKNLMSLMMKMLKQLMINNSKHKSIIASCLAISLFLASAPILAGKTKFYDPSPREKELMQASMVGDVDMVKSLLDHNVSANAHGRYGKNALTVFH